MGSRWIGRSWIRNLQTPAQRCKRSIPGKAYLRFGQFPQAMVQLDKLAHVPNLTEPQKKLVNDLLEQTKQVVAKAPPPGQ
jgi:hypothetical protein